MAPAQLRQLPPASSTQNRYGEFVSQQCVGVPADTAFVGLWLYNVLLESYIDAVR